MGVDGPLEGLNTFRNLQEPYIFCVALAQCSKLYTGSTPSKARAQFISPGPEGGAGKGTAGMSPTLYSTQQVQGIETVFFVGFPKT
jgi:hypothetical protein